MTPRQKQVLTGVQRGLSNKQIGKQLKIAESTVKTYVSALFKIHAVQTRQQLALFTQPKKEWVGLTDDDFAIWKEPAIGILRWAEATLKERNT